MDSRKTRPVRTSLPSWLKPHAARLVLGCFLFLLLPTAASADNLIARQLVTVDGPEAERSFWDPDLWQNNSNPGADPRAPTTGDWLLYFQRDSLGPLGSATRDFTLRTAAWGDFSPPGTVPEFSNMTVSQDENLMFFGLPEVAGNPLGRFLIGDASGMDVTNGATVFFDHTLVTTQRTWVRGISAMTVEGDLSSFPETINYNNTGVFWVQRSQGAPLLPALTMGNGTRVDLGSLRFSFSAPIGTPATGAAPAILGGENTILNIGTISLEKKAGTLLDFTAGGSVVTVGAIEALFEAETVAGADEPILFRAGGDNPALSATLIQITGQPVLRAFSGTVAEARDGAIVEFDDPLVLRGSGQRVRFEAHDGALIRFPWLITDDFLLQGDIALEMEATNSAEVEWHTQPFSFLRLGSGQTSFRATGGGVLTLPRRSNLPAGGSVLFLAEGAGSILRMPNPIDLTWRVPEAEWGTFTLELVDGASLEGGSIVGLGGEFQFADMWNFQVLYSTSGAPAVMFLEDAAASRVNFVFNRNVSIEVLGNTSFEHVGFSFPSGVVEMSGVDWRLSSLETSNFWQDLHTTNLPGDNAFILLNGSSVVHDVNFNLGDGPFIFSADPLEEAFTELRVFGSSVVTGTLRASPSPFAVTHIIHGDAFDEPGGLSGYRFIDLGGFTSASSFQDLGSPEPTTEFFFNPGGTAQLEVSRGARIAVGSYASAFDRWIRPGPFQVAFVSMNTGSRIILDTTAGIFIGDVESETDYDFRNGAVVVGPQGWLLGEGTILGGLVLAGGSVEPGFSPGEIVVEGEFRMESGTLTLEIGQDGFDRITAESIVITGGTIVIVPDPFSPPEDTFSGTLLNALNLEIGPDVSIQVDPELGEGSFDPGTGFFSNASSHDYQGLPELLRAVLPLAPNNRVILPAMSLPAEGEPSFVFNRLIATASEFDMMVEYSTDLVEWTGLAVPAQSEGIFEIVALDNSAEQVSVSLAGLVEEGMIFVRLRVSEAVDE